MAGNLRYYVRIDKILIFLDLLFCTIISPTTSCPSLCECSTQGDLNYIDCHDVNFTTLPNDIPLDTNLLFLSNTKISSFSANAFSRLSHLTKIELTHNKIENITDGVFNGLSKLQTLNLPNNGIKRISSNAFGGLTSLTKLSLSDNELTSLPEDMLKDQTNLRTLNLDNNQLRTLPSGFLNSTVGLFNLYLNKNQIQSIEDEAFKSAGRTLLVVDLENNKLQSLPRALNDMKRALIIQVGLGNNLIKLIPQEAKPFFEQVKNSRGKISLSGNPFVCSSGLRWFQTWIKQNQVVKDLDQVMCATLDGKITKLIDYDFNSTVFPTTTAPTMTSTSTTAPPTTTATATTTTATTALTKTTTKTTTATTATALPLSNIKSSTDTSPLTTVKLQTNTFTQPTTKLFSDSLTSTSRMMSTSEAMTRATDVTTRIFQNVASTQVMPANGSASSANITHNIFTKPTPKTDEADMTALERNKHIILATCLSAVFIGLVVFVAMYCFRNKIVKRDKVLSTRYDRVRIV